MRSLILAIACLYLASCSSGEMIHGHLPTPERLARVEPGISTKDNVLEILGSPSTRAPFDDDNWYYVRKIVRSIAFFEPEVVEQSVLTVAFDDEGVVEDILLYTQEDANDVAMSDRITPTQGRQLTIWEQILSNYGQMPGMRNGGR